MWVRLALQEQLCDSAFKSVDLGSLLRVGIRGKRHQLGNVSLYSFGKFNLDLGRGVATHDSANVDAEIGERAGAVFGVLSSATSDSLSGKGLDFVVDLPVLERRDLALHLAHLCLEIAEHLVELPGFGPGKKRHPNQDNRGVRRNLTGRLPQVAAARRLTASSGSRKTSPRVNLPSARSQIQATGMSRMPSGRLRA